ncbi:MAG: indolepyruvate ferredoxin oxidoreductase subunit alpha, partial [Candidatus Heimdallarchaeota archaeon]
MTKLKDIFENTSDKSLVLLGNEAIARGIVEAGVAGVFTYPGTPSTEIPHTLYSAQPILQKMGYNLYLEWSTNEAIALEGAFGFSFSGQRTVFVCKHVGLNVASDALMTLVNSGVKGGLVLIIAEDPHMHSSQNEQDNRWYTKSSNVPMFEPSDASEAKAMLKDAFLLSEKFQIPVILRTVTKISHSRLNVTLDSISFPQIPENVFVNIDPKRFMAVPVYSRINKQHLVKNVDKIAEYLVDTPWNRLEDGEKTNFAFITCGSAYTYLKEFLSKLNRKYPILKIGISHPFPRVKITHFLEKFPTATIIVIEEADNVLEIFVKKLAYETRFQGRILGRKEGVTLPYGELTTQKIWNGLIDIFSLDIVPESIPKGSNLVFPRPPAMCPGCPHRATLYALNRAVPKRHRLVSTDIGCYGLGFAPPFFAGNINLCMGSSIGIGSGLAHIDGLIDPVIAIIGDSTFWHAGLPGLVNTVFNKTNLMLLVTDNSTTAMTGFQPNPSEVIAIEDAARGLGVEFVAVTDAYNPKEAISIMKEAVKYKGVAVVVSKGECRLQYVRREGLPQTTFIIEPDRCVGCHTCVRLIACPAINWSGQNNSKGKRIP